MAEMSKNQPSQWWWLDSLNTTKRSPWLQSTLSELNEKTRGMLKLIEEDADSFAKRAEMYYKKRPELVSMVEDFYRSHRSLAERYDQVKPDTTGIGQLVSGGSPFASAKYQLEKLMTFSDNGYDTYSEHCDVYESEESDVDDPELEEEEGAKFLHNSTKEDHVSFVAVSDEVMKLRDEVKRLNEEGKAHRDQVKQKDAICYEVMMLREEIERLKDENEAQKEQLKQKDEEKIEVIRQLSLAIDVLKQENVKMRNIIAEESTKKWKNPFEFNKLVGAFSVKLFNGTPRNQPGVELSRCASCITFNCYKYSTPIFPSVFYMPLPLSLCQVCPFVLNRAIKVISGPKRKGLTHL
ncbi:Protein NETWORKED 3A, partial [Mucuna pruriens]